MNEFAFAPNPPAKILIRMIGFGILFGLITGFISEIAFLNGNTAYPIEGLAGLITTAFVVGGMSGVIYGAIAGALSGAGITVLTLLFFRHVADSRQRWLYSLTMALLAFVITSFVYYKEALLQYEFVNKHDLGLVVIGLTALIAALVSLYVTRKYLQEALLMKPKTS